MQPMIFSEIILCGELQRHRKIYPRFLFIVSTMNFYLFIYLSVYLFIYFFKASWEQACIILTMAADKLWYKVPW